MFKNVAVQFLKCKHNVFPKQLPKTLYWQIQIFYEYLGMNMETWVGEHSVALAFISPSVPVSRLVFLYIENTEIWLHWETGLWPDK